MARAADKPIPDGRVFWPENRGRLMVTKMAGIGLGLGSDRDWVPVDQGEVFLLLGGAPVPLAVSGEDGKVVEAESLGRFSVWLDGEG